MSIEIHIPEPAWKSELTSVILELEKLRTKTLMSEVPFYIFFQLKEIFQILETLGSARIEGNNTTLSEYVEKIIEQDTAQDEKRQELENIEEAINFIEDNTDETTVINRAYISHLHTLVTQKLTSPRKIDGGEGSNYPGKLRPINVTIKKSGHTPVPHEMLQDYFDAFVSFINQDMAEQDQLLLVAIAHHRFMYIHPFDNGNGRMGRLLNYALLLKLGFNVKTGGRIINPSSVFFTDRDKYYEMLSRADSLRDEDLLQWAQYFLMGLKNEIVKIDTLLKQEFVRSKILIPTLEFALDRKHITKQEFNILKYLVNKNDMTIKASELDAFGAKSSSQKSYVMGKLRDKKMVAPIEKGGRIYTIRFVNSYLLRGAIKTLENNGFIADFLNRNV